MSTRKRWAASLMAGAILLAGCGGKTDATEPPPAETPAAPAPITVSGSALYDPRNPAVHFNEGDSCEEVPGAPDDMLTGEQVKIADASGATLALGEFTGSEVTDMDPSGWVRECAFSFTVENVPDGHDFYQVVIGDRSPFDVARADLDELVIEVPRD